MKKTMTSKKKAPLKHHETTKRAPRRCRRGPKPRFVDPVGVLELPESIFSTAFKEGRRVGRGPCRGVGGDIKCNLKFDDDDDDG